MLNNKDNQDNQANWFKHHKICMHPQHKMPSHMVIKPGQSYTHTCPLCGQKTTVYGKLY